MAAKMLSPGESSDTKEIREANEERSRPWTVRELEALDRDG